MIHVTLWREEDEKDGAHVAGGEGRGRDVSAGLYDMAPS